MPLYHVHLTVEFEKCACDYKAKRSAMDAFLEINLGALDKEQKFGPRVKAWEFFGAEEIPPEEGG